MLEFLSKYRLAALCKSPLCDYNPILISINCIMNIPIIYISYIQFDKVPVDHWSYTMPQNVESWWRHQMETFSALLAFCAGNSPVTGEFPAQRPVPRSFDVFFDLCLNKRLSKQSRGWRFETLSRPLWPHCNEKRWCPDEPFCVTHRIMFTSHTAGHEFDKPQKENGVCSAKSVIPGHQFADRYSPRDS